MRDENTNGPVDGEPCGMRELSAREVEDVGGGWARLVVWALVTLGEAMLVMAPDYKQGVKDLS